AGRTWQISLTIDALKRVKSLLQIDLTEPLQGEPPLMTRLAIDVLLLCDVLFALIKPQADAAGVSDEVFGASLGGEAILAAQEALTQEWLDFFQNPRRTHLVTAIQKQRDLVQAIVAAGEQRLAQIQPDQAVAELFGGSSTAPPVSSASSPAP
ncbi:MAG: hypothetical protein ACK6D3_22785, partial [Planctomycetaceae bacterium]